jgi:tRNA dimethylallyltransferase
MSLVAASRTRLVAIVGPTASGKTALALDLAQRVGGEIVSADARQVYRGLDVGTAKPTADERRRVAHHCLDLAEPSQLFDVARYCEAADAAIAALRRRGRPVVVVGGTGLYVRVLLRGLCAGSVRDEPLRRWLVRFVSGSGAEARRWLLRLDPAAADRIHRNDHVRMVRALEVALGTGRPLSGEQAAHGFAAARYDALVVGLAVPQAALQARIAARAHDMVARGWLEEVATLHRDQPPDAPAWQTLGYRELRAHLAGETSLAEALAATVSATRRFAKRQGTWFRREADVCWHDPVQEREGVLDVAAAFLVANPPDAG